MNILPIKPSKPTNPIKQYTKVIMDVDAGADDFHALLLLAQMQNLIISCKDKQIQIMGVTCCFGNTKIQNVIKNVSILRKYVKGKFKIYKGCQQNLHGSFYSDNYFGEDGLSNYQNKYLNQFNITQEQLQVQDIHASQFIKNTVMKYPHQVGIICTGPLSNLAVSLMLKPEISKMMGVVIMGGAYLGLGNTSDFNTQFNMKNDCLAAKYVFNVIINNKKMEMIYLVPYQLMYQANMQIGKHYKQIFEGKGQNGKLIKQVYQKPFKGANVYNLCDPLTVFPITMPEMVDEVIQCYCRIQNPGYMQIDWLRMSKKQPNTTIITNMKFQSMAQLLINLAHDSQIQ